MENDINNLQVFKDDHYLNEFREHFMVRNNTFYEILHEIEKKEGSLQNFAKGNEKYGFNIEHGNLVYREYAPGAKEVYLFGEFNNWDRRQYGLTKDAFGNWEIKLPFGQNGESPISHGSRIKVHVLTANNEWVDRIPVWIKRLYQDDNTKIFDGVYWSKIDYKFNHPRPSKKHALKIYECHIGMAGVDERVHNFQEFRRDVLPRIKRLGYNTIQIMAIAEHAYYGSFGYHVTNLFGVSSRFGTPEDFKQLIDEAHGMGIHILIDIVHSHASKNVNDGFNQWDGTDYLYFHEGAKGNHNQWDSKLYNYGKWEVLRLLLSNVSWFMKEYNVDGFRYDGVTSMLYKHHGLGVGFTGGYHEYFNYDVDIESLVYLMLANKLIHEIYQDAISIAEDVSGYPTLCRKIEEGGIGFDYRLQMAVPDKWIKLLKEFKDDEWDMEDLVWNLINRRYDEKCIVYSESHDQALVGDKTLAMWLFDKEIYFNMSEQIPESVVVNRGMSLHKIIRLITIALGGEGYLNFMGNEFGHPEWIDFPRQDNGWSFHYCRRRWDLIDNPSLRYKYLNNFDMEMIELEENFKWLNSKNMYVSTKHQGDKVIAFERNELLFVFNLNPTQSFQNYKVGTSISEDHIIIFDTDEPHFGGHDRVRKGHEMSFITQKDEFNGRPYSIHLYLPSRCGIVLTSVKRAHEYWQNKIKFH
ncbi:hypothetical protein IMG5_129790 [Ichthyophthirius multifiliis]|uniref:1,4-alpha-glucan branching enzyme n=1 Tax=Ichthyophthirius multifiliis TaxID=5932 RepID=G0QW71_ICHMU|nr:hypothetical protein IMG5_129790 [Ichthyophthirius multifiliis]EGR30526.1 hypothetical protein IMG5_129790 [Ichthyophthirius multifiliis]|eukprot:XP_004032113.1 hypothetical protein IMG5_129790 [Ichthyophthirius multifiliis]